LTELEKACVSEDFENSYKIAHKLKSSIGLLKINSLLCVLTEIEQDAKEQKNSRLESLAKKAIVEFKKIESPLKFQLSKVAEKLRVTVQ
jgi:HPt (histidine-containing phosphotransfer) domain-containing protein